jgi:hypothetical protein
MTMLYFQSAETRLRLRKARDAVETLLSADAFDVAAADALAYRGVYAAAASCLLRILARPTRI